jgi:hypothetical protein
LFFFFLKNPVAAVGVFAAVRLIYPAGFSEKDFKDYKDYKVFKNLKDFKVFNP